MRDRFSRRDVLSVVGRLAVTAGGATVIARLLPGCGGGDGAGDPDGCIYLFGDDLVGPYYDGNNYAYVFACQDAVPGLDCYDVFAYTGFYAYSSQYLDLRYVCAQYVRAE